MDDIFDDGNFIQVSFETLNRLLKDQGRLDYLQKLLDEESYTGRCIMRWSGRGRGWRLHETRIEGGVADVRQAIDEFIEENG